MLEAEDCVGMNSRFEYGDGTIGGFPLPSRILRLDLHKLSVRLCCLDLSYIRMAKFQQYFI